MKKIPKIEKDEVIRLWFWLQGLSHPRGTQPLSSETFSVLLNQVGGLQLDTINVVERAHLLTLWSRFGVFSRDQLQDWTYREGITYEYWGHEACILPIEHLPVGKYRMKHFPPERWAKSSWYSAFQTSVASQRRVIKRLREEGPHESKDFETKPGDQFNASWIGKVESELPVGKEDKRTLNYYWHKGKVAITDRVHFRRVYDLADRVYPKVKTVSRIAYEDSWLFIGLRGNGVATEKHLTNYFTAPLLTAGEKRTVIERNLKKGLIKEVQVHGADERWFVLPEHLEMLGTIPPPEGTTLICPFDSLLWQRGRAEELLNFEYRIEIYVPAAKRVYGYYTLPILHNGALVGRLDPKFHRANGLLEIKSIHYEKEFKRSLDFDTQLRATLEDLAAFVGAKDIDIPSY